MVGEATPRITASYLDQFQGRTVRIVGRVVRLAGDTAEIDADGSITVHLSRDSHLLQDNAAEIIGRVRPDMTVSVLQASDFGKGFDYEAANAVVAATHKYKAIFYDAPASQMSLRGHRPPIPPAAAASALTDVSVLTDEMELATLEAELANHHGYDDGDGVNDGLDATGRLPSLPPYTCGQHAACVVARTFHGPDVYDVHRMDGEDIWVCLSNRRKSTV